MIVTMHKAEKYALDSRYLSEEKRLFFMCNFGCSRKVYNLYVDFLYGKLEETGYTGGEALPEMKLPEVSSFKKEYVYLKEADSLGLANAKIAFQEAVRRYNKEHDHVTYTKRALRRDRSGTEPLSFRGLKGMPKFHAKARGDYSYTTNCQYPSETNSLKQPTIRLEGEVLYVPKLKEGVRLVIHRPLPEGARIGNVTFSMDTDGRIYAAIEYSYTADMDIQFREAVLKGEPSVLSSLELLGLDYSQKHFYVDSEGRKANYPRYYTKAVGKLGKLQRELARMKKDSANYRKKLMQIRKLHVKVRNQRKDYICKEASFLAASYDAVAVEDIDLRGMGQGLKLGRNLHDNGFGIFRERLAHKLEKRGRILIRVNRSYASTKTCSCCGYRYQDIRLDEREWTCPECGTHHDRDHNAAINIREEGRRILPEYMAVWLEKDQAARDRADAASERRRKKTA